MYMLKIRNFHSKTWQCFFQKFCSIWLKILSVLTFILFKCECEVRQCLNEKYLHYRQKTQIYSNFYKFSPLPQKLKFYPTYGYEKKLFENWRIFMHLYLRCNQMHFEWISVVNLSKIGTSI